jgi:response regulator NasT
MFGLRIVLADADPVFRKTLKDKLANAGYLVVGEAGDGRSALQMAFNLQPDLLIMDLALPGQDALEVAKIIEEHRLAPVLLLAAYDRLDFLDGALRDLIFAYLTKSVDDIQLFATIEITVATFRRIIKMEQENKKLKEALETRKLVDRAKGLLAEARGMSEEEAYKFLQKQSMDKCLPLKHVVRQVIKKLEKR